MKVLGLYSGRQSWEKPFIEAGHDVETLDIVPKFKCTYTMDALDFVPSKHYDVILASPPCTYFSVARQVFNNTPKATTPEQMELSRAWFGKAIDVINRVKPKFFLIENPSWIRGARYYFANPFILGKLTAPIRVDYCMYGCTSMKPTDLWTNIPMEFRRCNHARNGHKSFQLTHGSVARSVIPEQLTHHVYESVIRGWHD
jgi:hypothetical protein